MRPLLLALFAVLGSVATTARGDDPPPPASCPAEPSDGDRCAAFRTGHVCRYPDRGVVCECRRITIDEHPTRAWTCGELGE